LHFAAQKVQYLVIMANDLSSAVNEYLDGKNADGFLYSGPINRDNTDR
jgi:hypothetical protein